MNHPRRRAPCLLLLLQLPMYLAMVAPCMAQTGPGTTDAAAGVHAAVVEEMRKLGLEPKCEPATGGGRNCSYLARGSMTTRSLKGVVLIRPGSQTVAIHVTDFLHASADAPTTPALLARLMELNSALLGAYFDWNPDTGEVRLRALLHTDSNFDRRAFRSAIRTLDKLAPRYRRELQHLQGA